MKHTKNSKAILAVSKTDGNSMYNLQRVALWSNLTIQDAKLGLERLLEIGGIIRAEDDFSHIEFNGHE